MKFGKNLIRVVELSDPEWGPYWINYKFMKKKINDIVETQGGRRMSDPTSVCNLREISKSATEIDFFRLLKTELKKTSDFFTSAEQLCRIRHQRVRDGFVMLQDNTVMHDKNTWTRLLMACVKFYKDVLLLENFAIMNYCGFSKILKKHDKSTGFSTREAFMRNVMSQQNFTHYPYVLDLLKQSEKLFADIQEMESCMPLQDEERLFIEAIRDLNYQASKLQAEENEVMAVENSINGAIEVAAIKDHYRAKDCFLSSKPISPLSRLAALAAASDVDVCASKTLDLAATAVMQAAQKANHNAATYNLEGAMSWIQAHRNDSAPLCVVPPASNSQTNDNSGGSNTTDEDDESAMIPGSKRKNKNISMNKRTFTGFTERGGE